MKLGPGNSDWGGRRSDRGDNDRINQSDEEWETMRKLQFTVASSTFGGMAFVGLFCTCIWLSCCRHKRTSRIRGRTWNTNSSFAIPNGTTLTNPHVFDPQGVNVMITPNYYSDVNLYNTGIGFQDDMKPTEDNTYRPFFNKPEWTPPAPPSYDTLSFVNPGYAETNLVKSNHSADEAVTTDNHHDHVKKEFITEKVLTSILATCDPSKRQVRDPRMASGDGDDSKKDGGQYEGHGITLKGSAGNSSAPPESIVSIESKEGGFPYPDGVHIPKRSEGTLEELTPPPFNPSYFVK